MVMLEIVILHPTTEHSKNRFLRIEFYLLRNIFVIILGETFCHTQINWHVFGHAQVGRTRTT